MPENILVIDDSPDIHALIKARLSQENVRIHSANSGAEGLVAARNLKPDLILLDVEMPDRDGFKVCADLKADLATMNIPVIFLTGTTSTEEKIRGLDLGAVDYITKPFEPAELRARVRASLRTKSLVDLLAKKAMIDGLTGLWNRLYLDARMASELATARRNGNSLACIMADVDRFKGINDTYGHSFGDDVLRMIGGIFGQNCREGDVVCRYGGEEFAILLPNTTAEEAGALAERLRVMVEKNAVVCRNTEVVVTCSFGVANMGDQVPPSLVELADSALYSAKHSGRNRVELCPKVPSAIGLAHAGEKSLDTLMV